MKTLPLLAWPFVAVTAVLPAASLAQIAGDDCHVPIAQWQPRNAVRAMAEAKGWRVLRIKIDDGCYEIYGHDASGRAIEVEIDPGSLAIVKIEPANRGGIETGEDALPPSTHNTDEVDE